MKKVITKQGLRFLAAAFFLFGLLLVTATRGEAQVISDDLIAQHQNANWKMGPEALTTLEAELENLSTILGSLTPGSQGYNSTLAHTYYFKEIYTQIDGGALVPDAVVNSATIFKGAGASAGPKVVSLDVTVDQALMNTMYNSAVSLLTN